MKVCPHASKDGGKVLSEHLLFPKHLSVNTAGYR